MYTPDGRLNAVTVNGLAVSGVFTPIRQLSTLTRYVPPPIGQNPAYSGTSSYGYDLATGQLMTRGDTTLVAGAGHIVADREYTRDDAGNVTSVTNTAAYPTASTQVDCYSYDHLGELTQVWSPGSASACGDTPSVSALSGPAPLWEDFTYDTTTGNRTGQTVHDTTGTGSDKTAAYVYPAAGAAQPHTVTGVTGAGAPGAGSYGYDAAGNTTSRPGQTLTYNAVGKLSTVTTSAGVQQNVYDASGSLLLQVDPSQGASLFLGDTVLHQTATGPVSGVRTYSFGDTPAAERTATAGVTGSTLVWLFSDIDGSVDVQTIATSGTTTDQYRDPFGNGVASSPGLWDDSTGFLGKTTSHATGLTIVGVRQFDTTLGRFVSADPIVASENPQQVNGYTYSANNPVTFADPSGECYEAETDALTHNANCAGGHSVTAASAQTKRIWASRGRGWTPYSVGTGYREQGGKSSTAASPGRTASGCSTSDFSCRVAANQKRPMPDDWSPAGYSYEDNWTLTSDKTPEEAMAAFQAHPDRIFPFAIGGCSQLVAGAECILHTGQSRNGGQNPVPIYSDGDVSVTTTRTSVTFTVLEWGYFDGPGSTIEFSTSLDKAGKLQLTQTAHALTSSAFAEVAIMNFGLAKQGWQQQARNLDTVLNGYK